MDLPLPRPPFLPLDKIEHDAEYHLTAARILERIPAAINIERFVEQYLGARLDQYATLPADVLGVTTFTPGQAPHVEINSDLTGAAFDEPNNPRWTVARWRSTVAHEAAHIIFHRNLMESHALQTSYFDQPEGGQKRAVSCLKRDLGRTDGAVDPREYQANCGMAALLMPRAHFISAAREVIQRLGITPQYQPTIASHFAVVRLLAERFEVSYKATEIRLKTLEQDIRLPLPPMQFDERS